ncbi:rhomboid family intramembrane serine protease [Mycolicibacterium mucogenicum]|uniref:Rhomboid family intramembrane serine protease n=1 Tax=Mycolicibacterium mucogenicum TaxID=56689 RepID=A0A1A3H176_MYCMU|nr:rhomboid family intramembrane serine protease [Mycolicibacterium mucogenicum]OBJ41364.1 rhomboid family intramembrane serine protease [Mycolicibacterium mucogenicum]TXH20620.1 MAG: rhomboid family intramembrane serine protease [Mycobacterium sp.]
MTVPTPTCYRHPSRPTYVSCSRCGRPICPDCMTAAAVGQQCPECVNEGKRTVRQARTHFGGRISKGSLVTYTLIAVNVVMFVLQHTSVQMQQDLVLWPPAVADGQYYRLASSAFLHYGLAHIVFNMWALWAVGPQLEQWLGRLRFGVLYGLSGLGGSVLVYLLSPLNSATAGASGAIFGLFGATFVLFRRLQLDVRGIVGLIVINLVITFVLPAVSSQAISWQGHVGGLVTGTVVAAVFAYVPARQRLLALISVTAVLLVLFAGLTMWRTQALLTMFS